MRKRLLALLLAATAAVQASNMTHFVAGSGVIDVEQCITACAELDGFPACLTPDLNISALVGPGRAAWLGVHREAANGAPDARITIVAPHPRLYYSGMLPAHVAGHYSWAELAIEAGGLLAQLGATFISTHVTGFDGTTLTLADGQRLAGDIVSFDIGTAPGALAKDHPERVIPVKPVEALLEGLARFERGLDQADKARRLAVVGGGAGGVELMLSLAYRYGGRADRPALDLVARSGVMGGVPGRVRRALARALDRAGVNVITGRGVVDLDDTGLILDDGTHQPADCVIAATGARAPAWGPCRTCPGARST